MPPSHLATPGVYIREQNDFSNSVVPVPTAVPAFIGYTPRAESYGRPLTNKPVKISSFAEFQAMFCFPNPAPPADPAQQYAPQYYLQQVSEKTANAAYININGKDYAVVPDPDTIYYLYNSIRLFYQNGGGDAYIVSVGGYGAPSGKSVASGTNVVNANVKLDDLLRGLALLKKEPEPTMYICPEATLLSIQDNATLMQAMLLQCSEMQTAISIFDVIGAKNPNPQHYTDDIKTFREGTGMNGLSYGTAYYPFIGTTIMQQSDINYTNLFSGDTKLLEPFLNPPDNPNPVVATILNNIRDNMPLTVNQYNSALTIASRAYQQIIRSVLNDANILPPSGAMAGVITTIDNSVGVWEAPANTSIVGAVSLPINLTSAQQESLNVDAVSGKSINAIRYFNGLGILVWGARTLDGNSQDWRYLSVKRTMIFLEQSCRVAANAYVFQPNDSNTWTAVKAMISNFLISVWKEGGLQGASPSDAFSVQCGLGSTMTTDDILNGIMRVTIAAAVVRPAEFIIITLNSRCKAKGIIHNRSGLNEIHQKVL